MKLWLRQVDKRREEQAFKLEDMCLLGSDTLIVSCAVKTVQDTLHECKILGIK